MFLATSSHWSFVTIRVDLTSSVSGDMTMLPYITTPLGVTFGHFRENHGASELTGDELTRDDQRNVVELLDYNRGNEL